MLLFNKIFYKKPKPTKFCKCNVKMPKVELEKLPSETIDKIISKVPFPSFIKTQKLKIAVIMNGYNVYFCNECQTFELIKKTKDSE